MLLSSVLLTASYGCRGPGANTPYATPARQLASCFVSLAVAHEQRVEKKLPRAAPEAEKLQFRDL